MADNDQLLDQIRKIVREENEPLRQDIQCVEQRQQEQGSMLSTIKSVVEATAEGQQELQKTAAREASVQDVKATLTRKVNDHEERIIELEKEVGIPHPHKH